MLIKASFDDGCASDLRVAELLAQYGIIDAVFYIPSHWHHVNRLHGDIPLTTEELKDLSSVFTIGSHTVTHPMLTRIPFNEMVEEVERSKAALQDLLGVEVEDFCYPKGYANDAIREVVRRTYKRARNTLVGSITPPEDPIWEYTSVHIAGNRRKEYTDTTWQEEADRLLRAAIDQEEAGVETVFHFWGHSWEIDRNNQWGEFEKFLMNLQTVIK